MNKYVKINDNTNGNPVSLETPLFTVDCDGKFWMIIKNITTEKYQCVRLEDGSFYQDIGYDDIDTYLENNFDEKIVHVEINIFN